jgi:hypothetical protein
MSNPITYLHLAMQVKMGLQITFLRQVVKAFSNEMAPKDPYF